MGNGRTPNIRLRERREQHRLTQAALAEALGVSPLTVGRWERGEASPTPYALKKLCTLLKATPQELGFEPAEAQGASVLGAEGAALARSRAPGRFSRRTMLLGGVATGIVVIAAGGTTAALLMQRSANNSPPSSVQHQDPGLPQLKPTLVYTVHQKRVESVGWHPSDQYLASASADGVVRIWQARNGDDRTSAQCNVALIWQLAWSPDGQRLALASDQHAVYVIPAFAAQALTTGNCPGPYRGHRSSVYCCAWSPDGSWIASSGQDETLQVWSASRREPRFAPLRLPSPLNALDWSPDGTTLLAGADDGRVSRYDAATGHLLASYQGHTKSVNSVRWSPDGRRYLSASDDGTVRVWDVVQGKVERIYQANEEEVNDAAWSADGRYLASGGDDRQVRIWEVATGKQLSICKGNISQVNAVAWSHHGYRVASAGQDKMVRLWDLSAVLH